MDFDENMANLNLWQNLCFELPTARSTQVDKTKYTKEKKSKLYHNDQACALTHNTNGKRFRYEHSMTIRTIQFNTEVFSGWQLSWFVICHSRSCNQICAHNSDTPTSVIQ